MHAAFRHSFAIRSLPMGLLCAPSQHRASPSAYAKSVSNNIAPFSALCMRIHPLGAGATRFCDDYVSSSYVRQMCRFRDVRDKRIRLPHLRGRFNCAFWRSEPSRYRLLQVIRLHCHSPMHKTHYQQLPAFPTIRHVRLYRSDAYIQPRHQPESRFLPASCNERRIRCTFRNPAAICEQQFVHIFSETQRALTGSREDAIQGLNC